MSGRKRELTGGKVLAIFVGAFGVIIAVNLFMAYSALSTFPGLEVQNSYVASQGFNARLAKQRALGWDVASRSGTASCACIHRPRRHPAEVADL
jgi:nitrogen fixation protein FixH